MKPDWIKDYEHTLSRGYPLSIDEDKRLLQALTTAMKGLEEVTIASNHAANYLLSHGVFQPDTHCRDSVLQIFGQDAADVWVCWDKAMKASAALTAINQEGK